METKHIFLECHGEHDTFLVAVPMGPENVELLKRRTAKVREAKADDEDLSDLAYSFRDFDVYLNVDPNDHDIHVDCFDLQDLPEGLPSPERVDFGQMVVSETFVSIRFCLKHFPGVHETSVVKPER